MLPGHFKPLDFAKKNQSMASLKFFRHFKYVQPIRREIKRVATHTLSLHAMTETHIRPTDNDSFLHTIIPVGFKLCHRLHACSLGGGVGIFVNENIIFKIFDSPTYASFENIVIDIASSASPFTITCIY